MPPKSPAPNKRRRPNESQASSSKVDENAIKLAEAVVDDADQGSETDSVDATQGGDAGVNGKHLGSPVAQRTASRDASRAISNSFPSPRRKQQQGPRTAQGKPEVPYKPRYTDMPAPTEGWQAWVGDQLWTMQRHLQQISSDVKEMHDAMQRTTEQHIDLTSKLEDISQLAESKPRVVEEVKKEGGLDQDKVDALVSLALSHHTAWPNWGKSVFWHEHMDKSFGESARNAATISVPKRGSFLRPKDRLTFLFGRHSNKGQRSAGMP